MASNPVDAVKVKVICETSGTTCIFTKLNNLLGAIVLIYFCKNVNSKYWLMSACKKFTDHLGIGLLFLQELQRDTFSKLKTLTIKKSDE